MPRYNYKLADGTVIERFFTIAEMQKKQRKDGSITVTIKGVRIKAFRDMASELTTVATAGTGWPLYSEAAGVQPSQVKEATEHAKKVGCPTEFTKDGRAIFTDRNHRKSYLKAHGLHDRNGGYGD